MLYVTTRDNRDHFTAYKTLSNQASADGAMYVPFQWPKFTKEQIYELKEKSFGCCVAEILNLFFSSRLDAWNVDFTIGRRPLKLVPMSHKITVAEIWNNPEWDFSRFVRNLRGRILGTADTDGCPTDWTWIAVRIAVLFGMFGEMYRMGSATPDMTIDIAVCAGDFTAPMSVWYAREMGLPVGNIILACTEENSVWELVHHGQLQTKNLAESFPTDLERLVFGALGAEETMRFCSAIKQQEMYSITDDQAKLLRRGMFCAVVSERRIESVIRSIYRTNTYLLSPAAALAYGGLQDYRSTNTEAGIALLLTEQGPLTAAEAVSGAIGITTEELKARIHTS